MCRLATTWEIASSQNETEGSDRLRTFNRFLGNPGSGTKLTKVLRSEGVTTKRGKPIDKGDIYKLVKAACPIHPTARRLTEPPTARQLMAWIFGTGLQQVNGECMAQRLVAQQSIRPRFGETLLPAPNWRACGGTRDRGGRPPGHFSSAGLVPPS